MKYNFNFKIQAMYGIVTFLISFAIIYLISKRVDLISPTIIGIVNFAVSGYTYKKCR